MSLTLFTQNLLETAALVAAGVPHPTKPVTRLYDRDRGPRFRAGINPNTWTARTSAADNDWKGIAWSPERNLFVAVAASGTGNRVMTSPDGITWTIRTSAADNNWFSVVWAKEIGLFVAVATTGTGNRVMTSPDGITWTARTSAADNQWRSVAWAPDSPTSGLLVAVSDTGTGNRVMTSPDGITWTIRTSAADNGWFGVTWSPELTLFCAVGISGIGNRVMTSPDGITWTLRTSAANNEWNSVRWSPELRLFCACASTGVGGRIMTSPDGITWTLRSSGPNNDWSAIAWSPELGLFCIVAATGTGDRVLTSPDGIAWTQRPSAADNVWLAVAWSPGVGRFAAVSETGTGNRVMTSNSNLELVDIDVDLGTAKAVSAWALVNHNVNGVTATLFGDSSFPPTTSRDSVALTGVDIFRTFASLSLRYWRLRLPAIAMAQEVGEFQLGVPRTLMSPTAKLSAKAIVGNVARDRSPAGYPRTTKLGNPRVRLDYVWAGIDTATDQATLEAAYAEADEGAKAFVVKDPFGVVRWMEITDGELVGEIINGRANAARLTLEEVPL